MPQILRGLDFGCMMSDFGNNIPKFDITHPKSKNTEGVSDLSIVLEMKIK